MKYAFNVYKTKVEEHEFWAAESRELAGCVGQGDTMEEALEELCINEEEWIATAKEVGIPIPEPSVETVPSYSGKFLVRVAPAVHKAASERAKKEGISLNQYVNDAIVYANASLESNDHIRESVNEFRRLLTLSEEILPYFTKK